MKQEEIDLKIFIDYREKSIAELLTGIFKNVTITQLTIGDYLIGYGSDAVIVERKTATDFWSSIKSNRLWDQLLRMMKTKQLLGFQIKRKVLLIHGNIQEYLKNIYYESEHDFMVHLSQLMGTYMEILYVYETPIIHAFSDLAFINFMRILAQREMNGKNNKLPDEKWYKKPARRDLPIMDRKKYILSSLPNVGNRISENLLLQFQTITNIATASVEDLQKVPKIGKKKAKTIYKLFNT
jgi:ERCC4-type nuclease